MRKNILILAVIAVASYLLGVGSLKLRGKNCEELRDQFERLWTNPEAKKRGKQMAKNVKKSLEKARKNFLGS